MWTKRSAKCVAMLGLGLVLWLGADGHGLAQGIEAEDEMPSATGTQLFLPVLQSGVVDDDGGSVGEVDAAFTKSWWAACTNVEGSQRGLWDDMPGASAVGENNEAGLFWIITDQEADENCLYWSSLNNVSTDTYPSLSVRVAVNDGARFKVRAYEYGVSEFCETLVSSITTGVDQDDSAFRTYQVRMPAGKRICRVEIVLDDDPNAVASRRATALIDYVRLWDGSNIGWSETFQRAN